MNCRLCSCLLRPALQRPFTTSQPRSRQEKANPADSAKLRRKIVSTADPFSFLVTDRRNARRLPEPPQPGGDIEPHALIALVQEHVQLFAASNSRLKEALASFARVLGHSTSTLQHLALNWAKAELSHFRDKSARDISYAALSGA